MHAHVDDVCEGVLVIYHQRRHLFAVFDLPDFQPSLAVPRKTDSILGLGYRPGMHHIATDTATT